MRRFSQRNSLVTLNEINITPLLDLAFVLLIIFIITRPMLEGHVKMDLPTSSLGQPATSNLRDVRVVKIDQDGQLTFAGRRVSRAELETELVDAFRSDPEVDGELARFQTGLVERRFRGDGDVMRNHISQVSPSTSPETTR